MNQTIQELFNRKSVRVYTDEKITEEEKEIILNAAIQAPTAGNMSLFSIIDVQSQEIKDILAQRCDQQNFISSAPMVLVFLADYQKWYDMFQYYNSDVSSLAESDLLLAMEDCMIAAHNAVVAAESLGIGSCYIGDIIEHFEENQKLLHLPQYAVPCTMVVFGKPTEQQKNRKKPERFCMHDIVSVDRYPSRTMEEIKEIFQRKIQKENRNVEEYISGYAKRKMHAEFREEMKRSVKAMLASWTD